MSAKTSSTRKQQRQAAKAKAARLQKIRYGGIVIVLLLIFAGIAWWRNAGVVPAEELAAQISPNLDGPASAPVRVVEYGDLACSACKRWHNLGIKEQLQAEFGDQISFEYRHFPVITATSPTGAEAAQCAAEQDAFWPFHDYIYENLEDYPNLGSQRVKEIATAVNLDRDAFDNCLDSGKYRNFVTQAIRLARADGARSTPTFLINGEQVFPSYEAMSATIAQILNN
ncbi:DsbA family protein [Candidatus Leptofilum sp.]|uniref:DsbA family protein n=1 Tax=Candidatus Leptofilum sp. TaxID=3241576 RepID=UPI003B5A9548